MILMDSQYPGLDQTDLDTSNIAKLKKNMVQKLLNAKFYKLFFRYQINCQK